MVDNNKATIVSLGYGTNVAIHPTFVSVLYEGSGLRFQTANLVKGCGGNRVFNHIRWVTSPPRVEMWKVMVLRHLVRRVIMM
eukprot:9894135-Ditylum_brightwellii.AAC.1